MSTSVLRRFSPLPVALIAGATLLLGVGIGVGVARAGVPADADALTYSGVLEDNGALVNVPRNVAIEIYDVDVGGAALCRVAPGSVDVVAGRFRIALNAACAGALRGVANGNAFVEVQVDGAAVGARAPVGAVPFALESDVANAAVDARAGGPLRTLLNDLDARLDAVEASTGNHETRLDTVEASTLDHETRVVALEARSVVDTGIDGASGVWRTRSVLLSGACAVIEAPGGWIQGVTNPATGECVAEIVPGTFASQPFCVATSHGGGDNRCVNLTNVDADTFATRLINCSSGALISDGVAVTCEGLAP